MPVCILGQVLSMFKCIWPHHSLVDGKGANVGGPEENIEQSPVHVVIITIVGQTSVSIFDQYKPEILVWHFSDQSNV